VTRVSRSEAGAVARIASLLADPTRMTICTALLDGRAWTGGELARTAGVAASTASEHLSALVEAGLLAEDRQGRHRYVRLAGPGVAQLIEDMAVVAGVTLPEPTSLNGARTARGLAWARTCYDHLAGRLGVALMDALVDRGLLDRSSGVALTPAGRSWLVAFAPGLDLAGGRRTALRECVDWTERRHHLGGALAAGVCTAMREREWIRQRPGERLVTVTDTGTAGLADELGIDVERLRVAVP
jgi:DNA-binding transcriptional ArsR family regulator